MMKSHRVYKSFSNFDSLFKSHILSNNLLPNSL